MDISSSVILMVEVIYIQNHFKRQKGLFEVSVVKAPLLWYNNEQDLRRRGNCDVKERDHP